MEENKNIYRNDADGQCATSQTQKQSCPDNYLVWAILTTCLCCMPFGIVAIVKAAQVERFFYSGNYMVALQSSKAAKKWSIVSAIVAAVGWILYLTFVVILYIFSEEGFSAFMNGLSDAVNV